MYIEFAGLFVTIAILVVILSTATLALIDYLNKGDSHPLIILSFVCLISFWLSAFVTLKYDYVQINPDNLARIGNRVVYVHDDALIESKKCTVYSAKNDELYIQVSRKIIGIQDYRLVTKDERDIPVKNDTVK